MDYTLIKIVDNVNVHIAQLAHDIAVEVTIYMSTTYPEITFILAPNGDASLPVTYLNGVEQ